jgi:hypothetical protein
MPGKSFVEVLEEQIRHDLRSEIEAEVRAEFARNNETTGPVRATGPADLAGRFESLLASRVGRTVFSKVSTARRAYGSPKKARPTPAAAPETPRQTAFTEPMFTATTVEQLCAIEMIKRHGGTRLGSTFTMKELKTSWRKAALATHPDRFIGADEITRMRAAAMFRELAESYELLLNELALETAA